MGFFSKTNKQLVPGTTTKKSRMTIQPQKRDEIAARKTLGDADRELYKYELPKNEMGMSDLLANHTPGTRFQYVALTGKNEESFEARVRRLVTLQPRFSKNAIRVEKAPNLRLIEDTEQFSLDMAIPKKGKDYIRLASVQVIFIPLSSSMGIFTKAKASLLDTRMLSDQAIQSVKFASNLPEKKELSMDYCVTRESAEKIILNISREQATMMQGEQWGACQLVFQLEETDFPYISDFKEVAGTIAMPPAVLDDYQVNPNHIDVTVMENNRPGLRDLFLSGDLADETDPIENKSSVVKYSKSRMDVRQATKGVLKDTGSSSKPGWEFMEGKRVPLIKNDLNSEDPEGSDEDPDTIQNTNANIEALKKHWTETHPTKPASTNSKQSRRSSSEISFTPVPRPATPPKPSSSKKRQPVTFQDVDI